MVLAMRIATIAGLVVLVPIIVSQLRILVREFAEDIKEELKK